MNNDTISAVATANGIGSIAIIRISGDKALGIAKKLTRNKNLNPRYATLTNIYDFKNELIDESIVIYFKAPFSFTAEDVVEIQCHGGFIVAQSVLKATIAHGARLATAGEFSKRAFFNGRIDLSQAEAIAQLIEAKSEDASRILAQQMKGSLKEYVENIRDEIIHILAYSEVSIDYAEEDLPEDLVLQIEAKLEDLRKSLQKTLQASRAREGLMQGFRVAIVGKPNVGKSSLLNALLNYNRAIVSDIAGTTRDTIEEQVKVGTHLIRIVDTAGIRESGDEIERIGIERSIEAIKESDIVVALFDASRAADSEDEQMLLLIKSYACDKHVIYLKNKIDLEQKFSHAEIKFDIELNSKESVDPLVVALENIMNSTNSSDEMMLISQRQISAVEYTLKNIEESFFPLRDQELEIFSFHLNEAVKEIASITRPFENDEMLEKMFGSFCLGK
ncbi:MAG: tRNA uridine-5-carboxymethylaminomethyl(34) synthesis GTPase MnmE [Sulfurimonas sp.]|jgi:tRNA modification GTPase|uniref:tRNA uridine-5-carboxymethylaminomethyl(34) synthesis GTPase MnmE n=1 Tax=unclassified Sulfurimonas TaxID=2623549 RepID=UPI0008B60310|nr:MULTISPECIES: tRNA uridine-5-carboxymethylaminomethyl(34) synthesis GTPase MnmE [unclassified Sulfurimonas]MBS4068323.1 tRNA uridine-5-carboxymethylaminomethyl(34) synthesis GTPase MnmE [Sulfurimonas sp.]MDD3855141.1 tRNA uridine-5-carboxymethylaminomethyl(34) synthesis GTPase MnmE [Sulfurimonas sp.]OHE04824.1 MAG: tRNA uridine-5-carboxymethylaminomethyl(34) synthesis GTPase MnmE [Sulfurimonas sp. RIFOXYB12_FULL_35_9]OHE16541.1 MAG: tRNA uridine-5-carboxymethylaminomethyl(34) synthesis GTPas